MFAIGELQLRGGIDDAARTTRLTTVEMQTWLLRQHETPVMRNEQCIGHVTTGWLDGERALVAVAKLKERPPVGTYYFCPVTEFNVTRDGRVRDKNIVRIELTPEPGCYPTAPVRFLDEK